MRYAGSEKHRKEIGLQLNKGESLHNLRQFILFARERKIYQKTHEKQTHQAKSLNLVTNAVVCRYTYRKNHQVGVVEAKLSYTAIRDTFKNQFLFSHPYLAQNYRMD